MDSSAVVIVAAGEGRRLGLGPKALVELDGETLLARCLDQVREAGFGRVVAVLPPGLDCPISGLHSVSNTQPESASLGSVVAGLRAVEAAGAITDLVVWPVDHPWVRASQLLALRSAAEGAGHEVSRIVPVWNGRRGHPIWIRTPGVIRLRSVESVLKGTLRDELVAAGPTLEISARDDAVVRNLNEPDDLRTDPRRA